MAVRECGQRELKKRRSKRIDKKIRGILFSMVLWGVTPSSKSWVIEHDALFHQEKGKDMEAQQRKIY
ncbi:hypothetical protein M413DRAFT_448145 [Hebeloma cylindrosporum]|uniref:Uncharacterized protein n=1 Tax=Hebeloma cylindrosporum TaxID=76867 RepID=A0A0C3BME5_HEBCY|nr:hypothetical protein M413DRAFT_448145 [Hebeloma cylindrosporum h7]